MRCVSAHPSRRNLRSETSDTLALCHFSSLVAGVNAGARGTHREVGIVLGQVEAGQASHRSGDSHSNFHNVVEMSIAVN